MMIRIIKITVSFVYLAVFGLFRLIKRIIGRPVRPFCVTLYYHDVTNEQKEKFTRQLDMIQKNSKVVPADIAELDKDAKLYSVLTFDDGFKSLLITAIPQMAERKIPATIFVPSGFVDKNADWDMEDTCADRSKQIMSETDLKNLDADLIKIGSHTVSHAKLTMLDQENIKYQLLNSKQQLEQILGYSVTMFSFPYGAFNNHIIETAKQAGYYRVFTIIPDWSMTVSDEFISGRVAASPDDWPVELWLKLNGAFRWMVLASKMKQKTKQLIMKSKGDNCE